MSCKKCLANIGTRLVQSNLPTRVKSDHGENGPLEASGRCPSKSESSNQKLMIFFTEWCLLLNSLSFIIFFLMRLTD